MRLSICLIFLIIFVSLPVNAATSESESLLRSAFQSVVATAPSSVVPPYLAIARDRTRWFARAACDDDGDNVIVISEGMMNLVRDLARAENVARSSAAYRELIERNSSRGALALPPPAAFFGESVDRDTERTRARSMFSYLIAHELTRFDSGEPICTHPDRLRESGDDTWTTNEQISLDYHQQISEDSPEASEDALLLHLDLKQNPLAGTLDLLAFFAEIEPLMAKDHLARATLRDARARHARLRSHEPPQKDVRMPPLRR